MSILMNVNFLHRNGSDSSQSLQLATVVDATHRNAVNCLTYFELGFCFAQFNVLHVFVKDKNYMRYMKRSEIALTFDFYAEDSYKIANVSINSRMDTVAVTAMHRQIYVATLFDAESVSLQLYAFKMLGEELHIDAIISISTCLWKPIVMTTATDKTIRIWNYQSGKVELVQKYQSEISAIALHPCGILAAVGFSDQLHLVGISLNKLKVFESNRLSVGRLNSIF